MRRVIVVRHPLSKLGRLTPGLVTGGGQHQLLPATEEEVGFAPGVGAVPKRCTSVEIVNIWIEWSHAGAQRMNEMEGEGWRLSPACSLVASHEGAIFRAVRHLDADGKVISDAELAGDFAA